MNQDLIANQELLNHKLGHRQDNWR